MPKPRPYSRPTERRRKQTAQQRAQHIAQQYAQHVELKGTAFLDAYHTPELISYDWKMPKPVKPYTAARLRRNLLILLVLWGTTIALPAMFDHMLMILFWAFTACYLVAAGFSIGARRRQLRQYRAEGRPLD